MRDTDRPRRTVCGAALVLLAPALVLGGCRNEGPPSADAPGAAATAGEPAPEAGLAAPREDFVEVGGVRLQVLDWGGEGDLLLFIPGVGAAAHAWTGVAPHFAADHRVVAVTRREHGGSDKPGTDLSLDLLADDLAGVIDAYTDEPAILVGWSFGGLEMTRLAARHPSRVRALVFVDALYDVSAAPPDVPFPEFPPLDSVYPSLDAAVAQLREQAADVDRAAAEAYLAGVLRQREDGTLVWHLPAEGETMGRFMALMGEWTATDLDGLDVPVLVIRVEQADAVARAVEARGGPAEEVEAVRRWAREWDDVVKGAAVDAVVEALPDARVVVLDDVSHMFPVEAPETMVELLERFLEEEVR